MNRSSKYQVIISGDRKEYEIDPRFSSIAETLQEMIWVNDVKTYYCWIHQEPTFHLIRNQFSFQNRREFSGEQTLSYKKYLSEGEIRSLSYWDYHGEKIHGLMIYGRWDEMWESVKSKDLFVVTKGLIDYLSENKLTEYHEETIKELQQLNLVAKFCQSFDYEILFFDPDV